MKQRVDQLLVERGLVKAGAKLTDAKGRVNALVRADLARWGKLVKAIGVTAQ